MSSSSYGSAMVPKTVKHCSNAPKLELYLFPLNEVEEVMRPEALENRDPMETKPLLLKLPIEIFLKIIEYVLDRYEYSHTTYYSALLSLRRISKRWAEVMDDASKLWTRVSLDSPEELVEMALKKSRGRPLDISGRRGTSSIAARVEAEAHRWRTLELDSPGSYGTFINLLSQPAPLLEILNVTSSSYLDPTIPIFNYAVPNIRVIKICGCQLPWGSPHISNLQELSLQQLEGRAPSITEILDILHRSPHLTHLHISFSMISLSPFSSALRVKLPHLQSLVLEYLAPEVLNRLVRSIEVPHDTSCTFHVPLEHDDPLEEQLAHISERLGSLELIPQTEPPILSLKANDGKNRGMLDLFGIEAELRYFAPGRSNAYLAVGVGAPLERHIDILNFFASRLQFSSQSWSPELRLTDTFHAPHIDKTIHLLGTLSQALPSVRIITFIDTTNRVDRTTDILQRLFPPDLGTTRLFPHLAELTIQARLHDPWANSFAALGTDQGESGVVGHFPLGTLRFRGGAIRRESIELLQGVVPSLLLDDVKVQ
ncbi:hypothetical protein FRC04_001387 [Tulasnella sp. 424]|nr:hypothetical protein FRC04_001387 [Tulasnella sp. 424]KAG8968825.1 hypothetical protein FRC05_001311 [Tulasnella sp. 425]